MALFTQSEMLSDMAAPLIADHYPEIRKYDLKIVYMFKSEMPGKAGSCRKVSDQDRVLHGFDFIITLAKDLWDHMGVAGDTVFQTAVLDHELAHVGVAYDEESGEPRYDKESGLIRTALVKHDVEEFESIIRRYGAYAADLRTFQRAFEANKEMKDNEGNV